MECCSPSSPRSLTIFTADSANLARPLAVDAGWAKFEE